MSNRLTPKQKSERMTSKMMGLLILCMSNHEFGKVDSVLMKEIASYAWTPSFNMARNVSNSIYRIVGPP